MTNSPTYNKQLALSEYWKSIGGLSFLPGTNRAADRFARASFYINALPETDDEKNSRCQCIQCCTQCFCSLGYPLPKVPRFPLRNGEPFRRART